MIPFFLVMNYVEGMLLVENLKTQVNLFLIYVVKLKKVIAIIIHLSY